MMAMNEWTKKEKLVIIDRFTVANGKGGEIVEEEEEQQVP